MAQQKYIIFKIFRIREKQHISHFYLREYLNFKAQRNQMSGYYSIRELAETVASIGRKHFNLPVKIQRVEDPRVEADRHPFEPIFDKLPREFAFEPKVTPEEAVYGMFELLTQREIRERIEQKRHLILPKTWWSGVKKPVETIEMLEDETVGKEPSMARALEGMAR